MKNLKSCMLRFIAVYIFFITFIYSATKCDAQSSTLLALSKGDHVLAIVDPVTFKVTARIPVGSDPHEVIASSDGKTAYVSIYGGGSLHTINVIDLTTQKRLADIDTKPLFGPHDVVFVGGKVWFTAEGSKAVGRYDPATEKLDWSMGTGEDRTHMLYVAADGKRIYTTNVSSGTVSILVDTLMQPGNFAPQKSASNNNMPPPPGMQPRENWIHTIIPVSRGAEGFDVSADSTELWTASAENGNIYIINLTTKKLTQTIDANVHGANRLKFTPDGKMVFITSLGSGNLTIYDAHTRKLLKQINIGNGAAGILMQPDSTRVYIACTPDNYIAVIDLKTLEVIHKIEAGGVPDGLAWAIRK